MQISSRGLALIKKFEGLRLTAYFCPAGIPTIGYGNTHGVTAEDVRNKRTITVAQAEDMLRDELRQYEIAVSALLNQPNRNEFDSACSLAYNIGTAGFAKSSVVKAHNRGDKAAAAKAFLLWDKATVGGKKQVLAGLARRRAAEAALYLEPVFVELDAPTDMPQAVEPERSMSDSSINRASLVAGGTAGVAAVSEVVGTVNQVKYGADQLGDWLLPVLLIAVVGLCGYIIWQRFDMRKRGLA